MQPKISVIIPVYNVEEYVERCIKSIINQTYQNLEIIIVNDGSTDNSENICKSFAHIDNRIKYYYKSNGGLSDARNLGLKHASGEFVSFVDSDDCLSPIFFEKLVNISIENNAEIVSCGMLSFHNDDELKTLDSRNSDDYCIFLHDEEIVSEYLVPRDKDKTIIYHGLCMKLYKRNLFENLWFEIGRKHEDLYITYLLLSRTKNYVYINTPLYYYYRDNKNSITNTYGPQNFVDECDGFFRIIDYFYEEPYLNQIYCFGSRSLFESLVKASSFINSKDILNTKKSAIQWIKKHVLKTTEINLFKRIVMFFMVNHTSLYAALRLKIKGH